MQTDTEAKDENIVQLCTSASRLKIILYYYFIYHKDNYPLKNFYAALTTVSLEQRNTSFCWVCTLPNSKGLLVSLAFLH